jgi:1-pyrroline-5-carboxylate dehydrogenase
MFDAITDVPAPVNEPVHNFASGSPERSALENLLKQQAAERVELSMTIGGEQRLGGAEPIDVVQPHRKHAVLGTLTNATPDDVRDAIEAARAAAPGWQRMSYDDRAAIFLKAADLLAGPWRRTLAAATMLGQSKTCYQAEIDTPCELVDFWRFNVWFGRQIRAEQPISSPGCGTGSTTAPSRASCSRSPRSTSPPSPVTCPPRRR